MVGTEKKNSTKFQIINYIINHKATSKVELSRNLNLSMPTVLSNVNELLASGIVVEMGEYESTGGRKAKMISINPAYRYAVGIRITAKHVGFVLVNLKSEIEKYERIRLEFSTEASYYSRLREELHHFLADVENKDTRGRISQMRMFWRNYGKPLLRRELNNGKSAVYQCLCAGGAVPHPKAGPALFGGVSGQTPGQCDYGT